MRILVILLLLTSYVHAQSDCIVKLPVEGGDSVVFNLNTVLYAVQTNNRTGVALNDNNVRSGYIRTGVVIDTVVARCNNELILFTDAQNGLKTAINRQQILEVKRSISNKAVIVAKWNPRLSFTSTESYASIRALVDACSSGGGSGPITPTQSWVNSTGLTLNTSAFAYGNGLFLALSYPNNIIVSTDARQWRTAATLTNADFDVTWGLAYGNGVFVAITNRDSVVVSSDGISWTKHKITGVTDAYTIGFGNGKFIIVADDTKILYSTDGATWTTSVSTVGATEVESKAVYGSGRWVIVGFNRSYSSGNAITWTSSASSALTANYYQAGEYGNGRWVFIDDSFSYTSTNGTVWTKTSLPSSDPTAERGFTFGQGKFMLSIGEKIYSSLDGVTWTQVHTAAVDMTFAAYGNGIFTFLTNGNAVSYLGSTTEPNITEVLAIPATGVSAGSYTNANITVASDGRITAASNGSGATAAGNTGQIQYNNNNAFAASSNLFWDITDSELGVGTATPAARIHAVGAGTTSATDALLIEDSAARDLLVVDNAGRIEVAQNTTVTTQNTAVIANLTTNSSIAIVPNGTGAIIAATPDGSSNNGNARGSQAVDLQLSRLGATNVASGSTSALVGGRGNRATDEDAGVFAGNFNQANGEQAIVVGGVGNFATANRSAIIGGTDGGAYLYGQIAKSNGMFASRGDAQASQLELRRAITGKAQTELFLDGSSVKAVLRANNQVWNANVQCAAVVAVVGDGTVTAGDALVQTFDLGIKRITVGVTVTTSLIGTVDTQLSKNDTGMAGATFTVDADDTNEALRIQFTPATNAGTTTVTHCHCVVKLSEVGY